MPEDKMRNNVKVKGKLMISHSGDQVTKSYYHYLCIQQAQNVIFRNPFTLSSRSSYDFSLFFFFLCHLCTEYSHLFSYKDSWFVPKCLHLKYKCINSDIHYSHAFLSQNIKEQQQCNTQRKFP